LSAVLSADGSMVAPNDECEPLELRDDDDDGRELGCELGLELGLDGARGGGAGSGTWPGDS